MDRLPNRGSIKRGKQRDLALNIASHDQYWDGIWRRNDEEYWSIYKPKEIAHDIIQSN